MCVCVCDFNNQESIMQCKRIKKKQKTGETNQFCNCSSDTTYLRLNCRNIALCRRKIVSQEYIDRLYSETRYTDKLLKIC